MIFFSVRFLALDENTPWFFLSVLLLYCWHDNTLQLVQLNQTVIEVANTDSVVAVYMWANSSCANLNFLSVHRKYILCWTYMAIQSMLASHFRFWEIMVHRNLKVSSTISPVHYGNEIFYKEYWYSKFQYITLNMLVLTEKLYCSRIMPKHVIIAATFKDSLEFVIRNVRCMTVFSIHIR